MAQALEPEIPAAQIDYSGLVRSDQIHGSLYTDPRVFADEMERIFLRGWVFVGHESEIPEPGQWVTRRLGLEPVIFVRGQDGAVRVLANRCAHRGTTLCTQTQGTNRVFTCPYHGWTFGLDGGLRGVPGPGGMHKAPDALGLDQPGQVASYQGFVFANQSGDAGPLDAHLGEAGKMLLDRAVQMSPTGRLELRGGWLGQDVASNWKMWPESNNDGYHVGVTHASLAQAVPGSQYDSIVLGGEGNTQSVARDHGLGHVEIDFRASYPHELAWLGVRREKVSAYCDALEAAYGRERAEEILWDGPPHALIFPNLFLGEMNIAIMQPVATGRTLHYHTPLLLEGVDAGMNRRILLQSEAAMGPAAFFLPDDVVVAERMQRAFVAGAQSDHGWIDLSRGAERERREGDQRVSDVSDETTNRGFWRHYRDVMAARASAG